MSSALAYEPVRELRCGECGAPIVVSARTDRRVAQQQGVHLCQPCRYPAMIVVTDALLEWWTDRYGTAEIVELAEGLWGSRSDWPENPPQLRL